MQSVVKVIFVAALTFLSTSASARTIVVQPGETLWRIATRELGNGNRWQELAAWNGIQQPYTIAAGQQLELRDGRTPRSTTAVSSTASPQTALNSPTVSGVRAREPRRDMAARAEMDTPTRAAIMSATERAHLQSEASRAPIVKPEATYSSMPLPPSEIELDEKPVFISLTLQQAIQIAYRSNLSIRSGALDPASAKWSLESARGAFDPSLSASIDHGRDRSRSLTTSRYTNSRATSWDAGVAQTLPLGTSYDVSVSNSRSSSDAAASTSNPLNSTEATLSVTQPLLDGFGRAGAYSSVDAAEQSLAAALRTNERLQTEIALSVANAYLSLGEAEASEATQRTSYRTAVELLQKNVGKAELGLISELEVLTARTGVASRRESLIAAIVARRKAAEEFLFLLNGESSSGIGELPQTTSGFFTAGIAASAHQLEAAALATREDLRAKKNDLRRSEIQLAGKKNGLLPDLDLTGSIGTGGRAATLNNSFDYLLDEDEPSWSAGLSLTIPLGNRSDRAAYQSALIDLEQSRLALVDAENEVRLEVRNAHRAVLLGRERLKSAIESRELSEARLRAELERLEFGLANTIDVLDAEEDASQARLAESKAQYSLAAAEAELAAAIGEPTRIMEMQR